MSLVKFCEISGREQLIRSDSDEKNGFSYADILRKTDNLPHDYLQNSNFLQHNITLYSHDNTFPFGYMLKSTHRKIMSHDLMKDAFEELFLPLVICNETGQMSLTLKARADCSQSYNALFDKFAFAARDSKLFECTKGWRNEKYTVHTRDKKPYFMLERAMVTIFGILTFGIHINGYFYDENGKLRMWIPRRSATKATWPLKLDNVVAGGLGNGDSVDKTVWKELKEEANLERDAVERSIKMVGCLSYFYFAGDLLKCKFEDEDDVVSSELEFIYDLEFPENITPRINDSEVHEFKHYSLQELVDLLKSSDFKPNCSLVVVDFLVRHGYITPLNEPNYSDLLVMMHRKLPFTTL